MEPFSIYTLWATTLPNTHAPKTCRLWIYLVHRAMADLIEDPRSISTATLKRYLERYRERTANAYREALTNFFTFLVDHGYRLDNPLVDPTVRRRRIGTEIRRALEPDEASRLLVTLAYLPERFPWMGKRVALIALGQLLTGLRPGEMLNLTTDRVHLNGSSSRIDVVGTKTGDDRMVPLSDAAREVFAELCEGRQGRITHIGTGRYHELVHRAGVLIGLPNEKARPYALRHTFATWLIEAGEDDVVVANLMGHKDLRHLKRYTISSTDRRRSAVNRRELSRI